MMAQEGTEFHFSLLFDVDLFLLCDVLEADSCYHASLLSEFSDVRES